jgi:hypothetical protein
VACIEQRARLAETIGVLSSNMAKLPGADLELRPKRSPKPADAVVRRHCSAAADSPCRTPNSLRRVHSNAKPIWTEAYIAVTPIPIMMLKLWRFIALLLAALSLTMEFAHVLELPQKMQYDAQLYTAVNSSLYYYFAVVGAVVQLGAIVACAILTYAVLHRRPAFAWTLAATVLLLSAFVAWLLVSRR